MSSRRISLLSSTSAQAVLAATAALGLAATSPTPAAAQARWIPDAAEFNAAIGYENQYNVGTLFLITNSFTAVNPTPVQVVPTIQLQNYSIGISGLSGIGGFNVFSYGFGSLTLTEINTFTGGLGVNDATLTIDGGAALGAGAVTLNSATLRLTNDTSLSNSVSLGNLGATIDTAGFNLTVNGPVSGSAGMFLVGGGSMTLIAANTFAGGTTVSNGRAIVTASGALGAGPVALNSEDASLNFDGADVDAGTLNITLNDSSKLTFRNGASAGEAKITVAADVTPSLGAGLFFSSGTTAGKATIINEFAPGYSGVTFRTGSNAGTATIENRNGSVTGFEGTSSAASATITNRDSGTVLFQGSSTAGSATIINEATGQTYFWFNASGGNARMVNNAGGLVDISAINGAGTTFGSIEGGGRFSLGSKTLTVGSNDRSTTVSGMIQGSGSLVKTGTGELTLSGTSTYTGGTTIQGGTIAVSADANLGAGGALTLDGGALRAMASLTTSRAVTLGPANGRIEVDANQDLTLNGGVSGTGGLGKDGQGTLHLNQANTYSGRTEILDGMLYARVNGALGTGPVLVDGPAADLWFGSGVSAGNSTITLNGGRVFFLPSSTAGDAQFINDNGGAVFFTGGSTAGNARITNRAGASVLFEGDAVAGNAELDNAGTSMASASGVYFQGQSSAGDARFINGAFGHVTFTDQSAAARATFVNNARGTIYLTDDATADHATIINNAGGNVDLSGHTGPLVIGSLTGGGNVFLGSNTLILGSDNASSVLEGSLHDGGFLAGLRGSLTKAGTGTLELRGESTYTGETLVEAGSLKVNGSLASTVTVAADAMLGGAGEIGGLVALPGSKIAPGNSIGTLDVAGPVSFAAGSTYAVEISAAGQSDRIDADGKATLSGGTVQILPDQGTGYKADSPYTILTAMQGVTGTFTGTSGGEFAFVTPTLRYTSDAVTLTLVRKVEPQPPEPPTPEPPAPPEPTPVAFNSVAVTKNQYTTADGVEALGEDNRLYDVILGASAPSARRAFDALSGELHATAATTTISAMRQVQQSILARLRQPWNRSAPAFLQGTYSAEYGANASGATPQPVAVMPSFDPRRFALWGEGFGSRGRIRSNGNAAALDAATGGFILGAETQVDPTVRIGLAGGFSRTTFDVDARLSSGSNETTFGAVYGSATWGAVNLQIGATYAHHDIDTQRTVAFPGFADRTSASYDGSTLLAFGELGYRYDRGLTRIEPFVGASVLRLHTDRFRESGGAAALTGFGQDYDIGTTILGLRAEALVSADLPLTIRGMLGWRRAYGDVEPDALLAFSGGTSAFEVSGIPVDRNALVAEAGLDWEIGATMTLGAAYSGQIGSRAQDHSVKGNFTWRFGTY